MVRNMLPSKMNEISLIERSKSSGKSSNVSSVFDHASGTKSSVSSNSDQANGANGANVKGHKLPVSLLS